MGRPHSEDTKTKIREALRGCKLTEAHKANISQALRGRTLTEEHKAAIGAANAVALIGHSPSEASRKKMSESATARWARWRNERREDTGVVEGLPEATSEAGPEVEAEDSGSEAT